MKIVIFHDKKGKKTAAQLGKHIKIQKIRTESCLLPPDEGSQAGPWGLFLEEATHLVMVLSPEGGAGTGAPAPKAAQAGLSPAAAWAFFAAGFAAGAARPLVYYGLDTAAVYPAFFKAPVVIKNEGDFIAYLEEEKREWTRRESYEQAKTALLDMGIPFNQESLGQCITERKSRAVALFLQAGFSPDTRNKAGVPLLCLAARAGDRNILSLLLKAGASVNLRAGDRGGSALIDGALGKYQDILAELLAAGADVNIKSKDGQSALIIAVGLNDEASAKMLLKAGADPDEPDNLGASARKYAALFKRPPMVALFSAYPPPGKEFIHE
ncbi:MAG: ankyrin repeat domain-containing protein [Treponema sp.]|jgi:hypothetical protein|nr:ankyrin repeat domain-containing protein [Treponema sp.]